MVVGVCRLRLSLEGNDSLKGKRAVLRSLIDRVKNRFNVAIAEVESQDRLQLAEIGLAVVSNDTSHIHQMIERIVAFVEEQGDAQLLDRQTELLHFGEELQETGSWADYEDE